MKSIEKNCNKIIKTYMKRLYSIKFKIVIINCSAARIKHCRITNN